MIPAWKIFSESGGSSVEYALVAALISVAIFAGADLLGDSVQRLFESTSGTVEEAAAG